MTQFPKFILQLSYIEAFSVMQIWLTHQSKALIFYFGMKNFLSLIFENLWETDKVNFTSSNWMCVYTHSKFKNMKFSLSVSHNFFKIRTQKFFYAKIENQSFRLMGWSYLGHFKPLLWESGKINFVKSVKTVTWVLFWISPLYIQLTCAFWSINFFFTRM